MKIQIIAWFSPKVLDSTNYNHGDIIDGDESKALEISAEIFRAGFNVMIRRAKDNEIWICVSDSGFGQR